MQTTIPEKKAARADDPPLPATLAAEDVPEDAGAALAKAELQELLDIAVMNRDAACRYLMECPEDVLQAEEAVREVQQAISQFNTETRRGGASARQMMVSVGQLIVTLSSTVAHACEAVASHEGEAVSKYIKRTLSYLTPTKAPEKKPASSPARHSKPFFWLLDEPAAHAPKLSFQQVSMVTLGSIRPAGQDSKPAGDVCSLQPASASVTGSQTVAVAMAEIRQSLNKAMGMNACMTPTAPVRIPISTATLADPFGFGQVLSVLHREAIAQSGFAEVPPGQKFRVAELFPPTAQPLAPLLKA